MTPWSQMEDGERHARHETLHLRVTLCENGCWLATVRCGGCAEDIGHAFESLSAAMAACERYALS